MHNAMLIGIEFLTHHRRPIMTHLITLIALRTKCCDASAPDQVMKGNHRFIEMILW